MKPRVSRARTPDLPEPAARGPGANPVLAAVPPPAIPVPDTAETAAIAAEGLSARQLRLARRTAQRHDLRPVSDLDAVRLLRAGGIDPFQPPPLFELVPAAAPPPPAAAKATPPAAPPAALPPPESRIEQAHAADIIRIREDIRRRRRRKLVLLAARLLVFVGLPTLIAGYYFHVVATPLYATTSDMVIQQADGAVSAGMSGLGGMLGGAMEANKDSIAVQSYLQSREAMLRLDADHGFAAEFRSPAVDPVRRLAADASNEEIYRLYQRYVKIAYDPTEGLIRMEVIATSPATSAAYSRALIGYAEQQIDHLTQRKREDQMEDARASFAEAESNLIDAQRRLVALQERHDVLSSDVEVGLITSQVGALQTQLTQERLSLEQMRSNLRPNPARMEPVERRIASLESEIAALRAELTQGADGAASLAEVQGELLMAQSDVATRQLMLSATMEQLENARIEANRQVRYLSLAVSPVPPDRPTYPRAFENTLVTMLIFAGIYLMASMTVAILREQVTS
jgi:capsular polysaccharide transport system permease protein